MTDTVTWALQGCDRAMIETVMEAVTGTVTWALQAMTEAMIETDTGIVTRVMTCCDRGCDRHYDMVL